MESIPHVIEKHSKNIVDLVLKATADEDAAAEAAEQVDEVVVVGDGGGSESADDGAAAAAVPPSANSGGRSRLVLYFNVISKFRNGPGIHSASHMMEIYMRYLAHPFAALQKAALQCILTWKSPALTEHVDTLLGLTDDAKFRETLAAADVASLRASTAASGADELFRVLSAVLYGKLLSRTVRGRSGGALKARRNAIARFLGTYTAEELGVVIDMMTEAFGGAETPPDSRTPRKSSLPSMRIQMGFLNLLGVLLDQIGAKLGPFVGRIMPILLRILKNGASESSGGIFGSRSDRRRQKDARNLAMKRITDLFSLAHEGLDAYVSELFQIYLNDRIAKFGPENVDNPSPTLSLLVVWSARDRYRALLHDGLLRAVFETLLKENVCSATLSAVLTVAENVVAALPNGSIPSSSERAESAVEVLVRGVGVILTRLFGAALKEGKGRIGDRDLLLRCVSLLASAADAVGSDEVLGHAVDILLPVLGSSSKGIPERVKIEMLAVIEKYVSRGPAALTEQDFRTSKLYRTVSRCFSSMDSQAGRAALDKCFGSFVAVDAGLAAVASIVADLNAFSARKVEEPDFDRRFAAFSDISQRRYGELSPEEWLPVLHNLVFSVRDEKEFSVRTNAAFCLVKLVDRASEAVQEGGGTAFRDLVVFVLLPAIKASMKRGSEAVRNEFLGLLSHIVKRMADDPVFEDMRCLVEGADDDSNVFSNLTHMQQHRRIRGLRKLTDHATAGDLAPATVSNIFFPYVLHIAHEYDRTSDHAMIAEAVNALGKMASVLNWASYYGHLRGEIAAIDKRPDRERVQVRLVVAVLDGFHFELRLGNGNTGEVEANESVDLEPDALPGVPSSAAKVHHAVVGKLLPDLYRLLRDKDKEGESEAIATRIPLALAIARLLVRLPEQSLETQLPKLLVELCQRLRSFSQDLRDGVRASLIKISDILGPSHFGFLVKELRTALTRGPQLHVLAFTVHALLASVVPKAQPGSLDHCIGDVTEILQQDLFGVVAEEKEVAELAKKMRESKVSKSLDSYELIASVVSLDRVGLLLRPLREIADREANHRVMDRVDSGLKRIASGLATNAGVGAGDLMLFIHGLMSDVVPKMVQASGSRHAEGQSVAVSEHLNAHLFVGFGLSLLLNGLRREVIRLSDDEHVRMLDPIISLLATTASSKHSGVAVTGYKVLGFVAKAALPALDAAKDSILRTAMRSVMRSPNLSSDLVQQTLKFLAVMIRDTDVDLSDQQIAGLISLITPELEETANQATCFALIKAIVSRKYISDDVYSLMDRIASLLVTSQSSEVRSLCRQVWLPFLLDYPQGAARVTKQLSFLISNLDYVHESGRESALEMLNVVCRKLPEETLAEHVQLLLLALIPKMVADESAKCRRMASELVKTILHRLDRAQLQTACELAHAWSAPSSPESLRIASFQLYGLIADHAPELIKENLGTILDAVCLAIKTALSASEEPGESLGPWQVAYAALKLADKLLSSWYDQAASFASSREIWQAAVDALVHPHAWIRASASRVVAIYLTAMASGHKTVDAVVAFALVQKLATQLKSPVLSDEQAAMTVKNMFLLAKVIAQGVPHEDSSDRNDGRRLPDAFGSNPLGWMILKFASIARAPTSSTSVLQRASIYRWFAALATAVDLAAEESYAMPVVAALYHGIQSETGRGKDIDQLKATAQEVMDLVQAQIGTEAYLRTYNKVHLLASEKRQERKEAKAILAVADPQSASKRKMQRNEAKQQSKKRKITERMRLKMASKQNVSLRSRNPESRV
ncbi:armadillo-type protein [Hyaloraphidium curvatum]|nr:armadillo-type protein [Hyaloraphidium curvatum]